MPVKHGRPQKLYLNEGVLRRAKAKKRKITSNLEQHIEKKTSLSDQIGLKYSREEISW